MIHILFEARFLRDMEDDDIVILGGLLLLSETRRRRRSMYTKKIFKRSAEQLETVLHNEMRLFDEDSHVAYFRMTRATFDVLLAKVGPFITHANTHSDPISPRQRLAVTLRILATGDSQKTVGMCFRMGKATVHQIVKETCSALIDVLQESIPSPTVTGWRKISVGYNMCWDLPHCIGAVDAKHVPIQSSSHTGTVGSSHKKHTSIILLAAVDDEYCFTVVDILASTSLTDDDFFSSSKLCQMMENGELNIPPPDNFPSLGLMPYFFVGDERFPLKENLQTPYSRVNLKAEEKIFNCRISRAKRTCDNAFRILAARWRIYSQPFLVKVETAKMLVYTTVLLHNFLKHRDSDTDPVHRYISDSAVDLETSDGQPVEGQWLQEAENTRGMQRTASVAGKIESIEASQIRDHLCRFFDNSEAVLDNQL